MAPLRNGVTRAVCVPANDMGRRELQRNRAVENKIRRTGKRDIAKTALQTIRMQLGVVSPPRTFT